MDSTSIIHDEITIAKATEDSVARRTSPQDALAELYAPIASQMVAVEQQFQGELQSPYESLSAVLRHGTQLGGKRLRPAMLLLSAAAVDTPTKDHVTLATVIEMVHTATLIHDDVLDDADSRRHVETVNARWNSHTSILLGDFLFAQSFRLAATVGSTQACQWIGEAARLVCEGELRQILERNTIDLDEATYIEMLGGKTAELCRVACQLGATHAGATPEQSNALGEYGYAMGIAFQIADDYLDLWGDESDVGKTLGTDLQQGKLTLPIIRILETADPAQRTELESILTGPPDLRAEKILPHLDSSDAKRYTWEAAKRFQRDAMAAIETLPTTPAKESLTKIARFAVERRF